MEIERCVERGTRKEISEIRTLVGCSNHALSYWELEWRAVANGGLAI